MSPWRFVDLDAAQKHARRETIDHYGRIAHLSTILPVLAGAAYQLGRWALVTYRRRGHGHGGTGASSSSSSSSHRREGIYEAVPGSPALKHRHQHQTGDVVGSLRRTARRWAWWLGGDVVFLDGHSNTWGQRDQWVFGTAWMVWLLVLSILDTGDGMSVLLLCFCSFLPRVEARYILKYMH